MALEISERFARSYRIDPDGCWVWLLKARNQHGNAMFTLGVGHSMPAHRYAYEQVHGKLSPNEYVYHTCKRPDCVNPAHMTLGRRVDHTRRWMERAKQGSYQWLRYPSAVERRRADRLLAWISEKYPPLEEEIDVLRTKMQKFGQRRGRIANVWRPEDFA